MAFSREKKVAVDTAKRAGKLLMEFFDKPLRIRKKSTAIDMVTQADLASEKLVVDTLKNKFPEHAVMAEETKTQRSESEFVWLIDPLDGTTNFVHSHPFFCVSIALARNDHPVVGVVYAPVLQQLFVAVKGEKPTMNGRAIKVSKNEKLIDCLLATGFPYKNMSVAKRNIQHMKNFLGKVHGARRDGAAAMDLSYVAAGVFDGFWEYSLHPWDVAAGKLLVETAGGKVTSFKGKAFNIYGGGIVASNGRIHGQMLRVLGRR